MLRTKTARSIIPFFNLLAHSKWMNLVRIDAWYLVILLGATYRRNGKLCVVKVMRFVLRKHYAILIYVFGLRLNLVYSTSPYYAIFNYAIS